MPIALQSLSDPICFLLTDILINLFILSSFISETFNLKFFNKKSFISLNNFGTTLLKITFLIKAFF